MSEIGVPCAGGCGKRVVSTQADDSVGQSGPWYCAACFAAAAAEAERLRDALHVIADRVKDDRREPDKILCHVLTARRWAAPS